MNKTRSTDSKKIADEKATLDKLQVNSERILYSCKTTFPFTLFPDTILVDQNKIDIVHQYFFLSKDIFSLLLDDLRTVRLSTGPIFATMYFEVKNFEKNPAPIRFLPKANAIRMKNIIMGLTAAKKEKIDLSLMTEHEVMKRLEEIGTAQEDSVRK